MAKGQNTVYREVMGLFFKFFSFRSESVYFSLFPIQAFMHLIFFQITLSKNAFIYSFPSISICLCPHFYLLYALMCYSHYLARVPLSPGVSTGSFSMNFQHCTLLMFLKILKQTSVIYLFLSYSFRFLLL